MYATPLLSMFVWSKTKKHQKENPPPHSSSLAVADIAGTMRPDGPRDPENGIKKRKWVKRTGGKHAGAGKRPSVKNQIRSVERMLKREGLPAKLREEKERELERLRDQGKENKRVEREKKLSTRYHKVKFFERVKITRRMEQLEKKADKTRAEEDELAGLKEDLEYVMNFPRGKNMSACWSRRVIRNTRRRSERG